MINPLTMKIPLKSGLFLYFKYGWDGMTFPAADMRIKTGPFGLFAKRRHLDAPLEGCRQRAGYFAAQAHELARIGPGDAWDRAGATQVAAPGRAEQTALLVVAAAIVIAVKIFTFSTGRCFHTPTINRFKFNEPIVSQSNSPEEWIPRG